MRLGLLADVHANLPALDAVLAALRHEGVDRLACAGDVVGFGPSPDACVARLAELEVPCVVGNHDLVALGQLPAEHPWRLVARTFEWTRAELGEDSRRWLAELPAVCRLDGGVVL